MNKSKLYLIAKTCILSGLSLLVFNILFTIVVNLDRVLGLGLEFTNLYGPFLLVLFIFSLVFYLLTMQYIVNFFAPNNKKLSIFIIGFPIIIFIMQMIWVLYISMTLELPNTPLPY